MQAAAACETVNVWPAIVMVPVRDEVFVFGAALKLTAPVPEPVVPPVRVIHAALAVAVHEQLAPVVTLTEPVPPVAGTDPDVEPSVKLHGAAACVIVNVWPPIMIVPVRGDEAVFAATV